jgi:serine/threonine protein kinase
MSALPHVASRLDLLKWVAANPNKPFDPNMVVSISTGHTSDWEWQAVLGQMEDLRFQGYVTRLKQDASGSTYWTITASGEKYLRALSNFEQAQNLERMYPQSLTDAGEAAMTFVGSWEQLKPLGEGGQGKVFLVRSPRRVQLRRTATERVLSSNPWAPYAGGNPSEQLERIDRLANSLLEYARPDNDSELGALKILKIEETGKAAEEAEGRLKNEITVLRQGRPGLLSLLDANEEEKWIVTGFMPDGTLDGHPATYKGDALRSLKAFRSIVETVAGLHRDKYVHRDIKPANVFLVGRDGLVLGDFGIVFMPEQAERLTVTDERVGPRDYMPQWADLGQRLENVHTNFDVYMLGKLLWCMVTGRLKLPREYHQRPAYDIKKMFSNDPGMYAIDTIIKGCVVEEPEQCFVSAVELLAVVNEQLAALERGGQLLTDGIPRPCRICGKGLYRKMQLAAGVAGKPVVNLSLAGEPIELSLFTCDVCHNAQLFREK